MTDKQKMLAAMLAGEPTKESEAIRKIAEKADGNVIPTTYLQEQAYEASLPSASNMDISLGQVKRDSMLGGLKPLPPVSEDELAYLFGPNKGKNKPQKQPVTQPQQTNNYYSQQPAKLLAEDEDRFENINLIEELKNKVKLNGNKVQQSSNKNLIENTSSLSPDIKKLVENYVYEILSEVISEANNHLVNKEQIKIQIGESLFIGNLQKAITMPGRK